MADANVYALKIELELDISKIETGLTSLTNKMVQFETALADAAKKSLDQIGDNIQTVTKALDDLSKKLKDDLSPSLEAVGTNLETAVEKATELTEKLEEIEKASNASKDDTEDLSDLFGDAGDSLDNIRKGWNEIYYWIDASIKGIEEFRTANYRLSGSMYEMLDMSQQINATIGDFGQSIQIVKSLNAIRAPKKDIEEFGVAVAKANVYTGVSVETLTTMTASMIKAGMSAKEVASFMDEYAGVMNETGVTSEDLTAILNDQSLSLGNLAITYSNLSKEGLKLAQGFQVVAMEYAAMAKEIGVSSSDVVSDISKAATPLSDVNMRLQGISGVMIRGHRDLKLAFNSLSQSVVDFKAINSNAVDPMTKELLLQQAMAATGLSKSTIILLSKQRELYEANKDNIETWGDYDEVMKRAKREVDPFGAATEDLNTQFGRLKRLLYPFYYALTAAAEVIGSVLYFINLLIDGIIYLGDELYKVTSKLDIVIAIYEDLNESAKEFIKVLTDTFGISKQTANNIVNMNNVFRYLVGTVTLVVMAMKFIPGIFNLIGGSLRIFTKILGFSLKAMSGSFTGFFSTISGGLTASIKGFFAGLAQSLRSFGQMIKPALKELLVASVILVAIAANVLALAFAIKIIADLGPKAWEALGILALGILALVAAFAALAFIAYALGPVLLPLLTTALFALAAAILALGISIALIVLSLSVLAYAFAYLFTTIMGGMKTAIELFPQFGLAVLGLAFDLLVGATGIVLGGIALIYGAGLLIIGAIALSVASGYFGAANALFGYAIGSFMKRAAEFFIGATALSAGAFAIYQAASYIKSANTKLSALKGSTSIIQEGAKGFVSAIQSLTDLSGKFLASATEYQMAATIIVVALNNLASSMYTFIGAAQAISMSAQTTDMAISSLEASIAKLSEIGVKLSNGLLEFENGILKLTGISAIFVTGSYLLSIGAKMLEEGANILYSGAMKFVEAGSLISIGADYLVGATDKISESSYKLMASVMPLNDASESVKQAAVKMGIASLFLIPASAGMAYSAENIDKFTASVKKLESIQTDRMAVVVKDISSTIGELDSISANSFTAIAKEMNDGVTILEQPVDRMIDVLGRLKDALVDLSQNINLDSSLGALARDTERSANLIANATEKAKTALDSVPGPVAQATAQGIQSTIASEPLSSVTVNTVEERTDSQRDEAADVNQQILGVLKGIMDIVGDQGAPKDVSSILGLLKEYLPDLKSSGGNLSSEFNSWG